MLLRLVVLILLVQCSSNSRAQLETALMPGDLISGHAKLEANCQACHVRFDQDAQAGLCAGCHKNVAADVLNHKGLHGRLDEKECRVCHTDHKGRDAKIVVLDAAKFDHSKTDFPLLGAHGRGDKIACKHCHLAPNKYSEAPVVCTGCHRKDDKHKGSLGDDCINCHNERDWKDAKFDHSKTKFALGGKHVEVACKKCHVDPSRYKEASRECVACHSKVDKHKGQYGKKCETCHADRDWKKIEFEHDLKTKFKLLGKHDAVKCLACHKGPLYKGKTPTQCVACHRNDDVHKGGVGEKCATCHNEEKWKVSSFNHDKDTKFPLVGKHTSTKCDACHTSATGKEKSGNREKLATTCIGCHRKDDKHKGVFGAKCESCHKESDWKAARFNHDHDTQFALLGKHVSAKCESCHKPSQKEKLAITCVGCHSAEDKHKGNFGLKCESCHAEKDWKSIRFDHDRDTKYRLQGKHSKVKCTDCHSGKVYEQKLNVECVSCHKKDDVHKDSLGSRCASCHDEKAWKDARIDHGMARFPLVGMHQKVECKKCHATLLFRDSPSACVACHLKDDSGHKRRLGRKCESCHNARSWKAWDFDHDTRTQFKLDGGHKKANCYSCHKKEVVDRFDVSRTCNGCHESDDVHRGELGAQCQVCHVTRNFRTLLIGNGHRR